MASTPPVPYSPKHNKPGVAPSGSFRRLTHPRAQARAAVGAIDHVHDRGEAHEVLARGADLSDLHLLVADLLLEEAVDLSGDLAPEVCGGTQLGLAVVEPEVHGLLGLSGEDDRVGAGGPHLGGEEAAALA